VDAAVVKAEVVSYIGNVIDEAQAVALAIVDDASCERAVALGSAVKERIVWLNGKRKEIYEPLFRATENVRNEYDNPLKLGKAIEKTLAAAVIDYKLKKRREEERLRLAAEAEAKRQKEDAERKEREAAAERERIVREREAIEQKKRDDAAAEERRRKEAEESERREVAAKAQREADERNRKIKEEEDARLRNAQEAADVGLAERSENILEKQTSIAPVAAPLPSAAEREAIAEKERQEQAAAVAEAQRKADEKAADDKRRADDAERLRKMDEEAAIAKKNAAEAEAVAAQQVTVSRPEERMNTSSRYKWDVADEASFRKLVLAVAQGRAPIEYLDFDPAHPEKFRASAITKDVTRLKGEFNGDAIGIRVWAEESGSFKV
jgi:hypothetical protein